MYIEFHSRSAFSFLEGASLPEDLIATCANLQMPAMALLDRDGVYGAPRFHMAAEKAGIKAHIGAEVLYEIFGLTNFRIDELKNPSKDRDVFNSTIHKSLSVFPSLSLPAPATRIFAA
jgi:DNA polymerase III alpha subunit